MPKPTMSDLVGAASMEEFGKLPTEEKYQQSLAKPNHPGGMKVATLNEISKARTRASFARLLHEQIQNGNVTAAFQELRENNPKVFLEKLMEFAEFSTPKLKSVEIEHTSGDGDAKKLTLEQLMGALTDDSVVSVQ